MSRSSDIRDWLREQGRDVPPNGRLRKADQDAYDAAMAAGLPEPDVTYPGDDGGPVSDSAASAEQAPRAARTSSRSAASGWLRGRGGAKKAAAPKAKRERARLPRVPVNKLIEHAWSDLAWAASGMPPMARLLTVQAPLAGIVFEDVVRDTAADAVLQPMARLEDKADKVYGMLAPPLNVMAVMATAPPPGEEPSMAHKTAWVGLRHSLLVMARVGNVNLREVEERAAENQARTADVESFMRFLFDIPDPAADDTAEAVVQGQVLYASATQGAAAGPA